MLIEFSSAPHIGHMYSMVLADILKRWQSLATPPSSATEPLLATGTDEHGMKVQRAAAKAHMPPKQFCDINAEKFKELALACNMDNDFFIRTTDIEHREAVEQFWLQLKERGFIYESTHRGWYCVSDECFYQESEVERRYVPQTDKTIMASIETGNEVEWTEEKNYHFRMLALKDRLLEFYESNPNWIEPRSRMNEVVSWVKNNLEDLSISRPANRLDWGIRVPDDPSQTIYVWIDALINYITVCGFPNLPAEGGPWPADVQVIGKDIVRFHGVYWPALLLALDIPLPRRLLSHAHWTLGKKKMSKSVGNVVNPFYAIERWGVDTMRFYLMRDGGIVDDADYGNEYILLRYQKDLQRGMGNNLQRICKSKVWNVRQAVSQAKDLQSADIHHLKQAELIMNMRALIEATRQDFESHMDRLTPGHAARTAMNLIHEVWGPFLTQPNSQS
jgi:methionyl-tRNA synthetase